MIFSRLKENTFIYSAEAGLLTKQDAAVNQKFHNIIL